MEKEFDMNNTLAGIVGGAYLFCYCVSMGNFLKIAIFAKEKFPFLVQKKDKVLMGVECLGLGVLSDQD